MHRARKRFGQHFLEDADIIQSLVRAISPLPSDNILEIGPGTGALTRPILDIVEHMEVIELDRDLIRHLQILDKQANKLTIHALDVLKFDFSDTRTPRRIVGNLPYNISTPIIFLLLDHLDNIRDMHFMLQKEVVNRICATTGERNYGRLSVMVQASCQAQKLIDVAPECFSPPPKVDSAFIRLTPRNQPLVPPLLENHFRRIVKACFAQPRKTLRNNLKNILESSVISKANIDPSCRPQQLTLDNLINLAKLMQEGKI